MTGSSDGEGSVVGEGSPGAGSPDGEASGVGRSAERDGDVGATVGVGGPQLAGAAPGGSAAVGAAATSSGARVAVDRAGDEAEDG